MRNYVINPEFEVRDFGESVTLTNGVGGWVANKWHVGPGKDASLIATFPEFPDHETKVPGYPERYMRLQWTTPPSAGEDQHLPDFRWTFLEHFMRQSRELMGKRVYYRFYGKVGGITHFKPIFWINYLNGDYAIFDMPSHSITPEWELFSGYYDLPPVAENQPVSDVHHYVGFGLDFFYRTAPTIDLAKFAVWTDETDVVENRPIEIEQLLARG